MIFNFTEVLMGILSWIIFGLIAGILAKWIMPGEDGGGFIMTIILGVVGALVGGYISTFFGMGKVDGFNFGSFVVAVIGSLVVLFVYRKLRS
ncbi:putative membrane protein [Yersinia enterocolitica (type O:9) str. YE212/02]|nr:putative membrane protein [Yersinia enterocolitica (type O:9) str. YE212/02]CCV39026.1 putative membrane protein [Yersinia enterocolitica (type O:9) str. YE56/03]CCV45563.1 putative membrane protein [Yersinia enterocolitica (type O:5,27) str. YE149/02]CCV52813.1 putative membrane protein [Yersinia enterocolitica (type O:3) str. YE12/03]